MAVGAFQKTGVAVTGQLCHRLLVNKRYERALEGKALSEKDLTLFEYYEWLQAATKARDTCLYGKLSQEEALRIIDVP